MTRILDSSFVLYMISRLSAPYHYATILITCCFLSCADEKGSKLSSNKTGFFETTRIDIEKVIPTLQQQVEALKGDSTTQTEIDWVKQAYQESQYHPFWIGKGGVEDYTAQLLRQIDSLKFDGIQTQAYQLDSLQHTIQKIQSEKLKDALSLATFEMKVTQSLMQATHDMVLGENFETSPNKDWKNKNDSNFHAVEYLRNALEKGEIKDVFSKLRPNHAWYSKFRNEYIKLQKLQTQGGWSQVNDVDDTLVNGYRSLQLQALRVRLQKEIGEPSDTNSDAWDENLSKSLQKFQFKHQIKATGILDSNTLKFLNKGIDEKLKTLALNMERMRWMRKDFAQPYIWVAVPKMELDYVENDSVQFNMRVVVGKKSRPTPSLDSKIENIVLSPPWTVPPTIMKEEIVPGIARRGGSYLARRGLKAYRGGRPVNPSMINSKNYKTFAISQAPGYRSSLGEVKFNMINPWAIYMHDTPHREDFVKSFRAYSSGCIRVHKPKQFAEFLLRDTVNYSYQKIDSICKKRSTIYIPFKRNVNVHIVYLTNALDSLGNVMYLKDVYGWDR